MTDAHGPRTSASRAANSEEGSSNWKRGVKWFAGEFLVVVAGILVALGLQAWWQDRQDASRGAEYERQLLSDVRETERSLRESIATDRAVGSSRVDLQACKLEYSIVSPK